MNTYFVAKGWSLRHNGSAFHEGDPVKMTAGEAQPKLGKSLTEENWDNRPLAAGESMASKKKAASKPKAAAKPKTAAKPKEKGETSS